MEQANSQPAVGVDIHARMLKNLLADASKINHMLTM